MPCALTRPTVARIAKVARDSIFFLLQDENDFIGRKNVAVGLMGPRRERKKGKKGEERERERNTW